MSRDAVLSRVRQALGRTAGQTPAELPKPILEFTPRTKEEKAALFAANLENLAGHCVLGSAAAAAERIAQMLNGEPAVAAPSPFLDACGITRLPNVRSQFANTDELRIAAGEAAFGISSVDYALADTGTMVMIASAEQARLVSLLPPVHIAIFSAEKILDGLEELLQVEPTPADKTSSMVLITGPSRTADIEQILVRGVHGPGEVYAFIVDD